MAEGLGGHCFSDGFCKRTRQQVDHSVPPYKPHQRSSELVATLDAASGQEAVFLLSIGFFDSGDVVSFEISSPLFSLFLNPIDAIKKFRYNFVIQGGVPHANHQIER